MSACVSPPHPADPSHGHDLCAQGLASEIARLNRKMEQRERERVEEDRRMKVMMQTIRKTIRGHMADIFSDDDSDVGSEGGDGPEVGNNVFPNASLRQDTLQENGRAKKVSASASSIKTMAQDTGPLRRVPRKDPKDPSKEQRGGDSQTTAALQFSSEQPMTNGLTNGNQWLPRMTVQPRPHEDTPSTYLRYGPTDDEGRKCYIGQLKSGKRHGIGVLIWEDGSKYSGEWSEDHPCGFGVEKYADGSNYAGCFLQDLRHGYGEFEISPGVSYCGQFEEGELHGSLIINERHVDGSVRSISARAENGHVFREPEYNHFSDNDPRKIIGDALLKVAAALKIKVFEAVTLARNASQYAHEVALEVSHAGASTYVGDVSSRPITASRSALDASMSASGQQSTNRRELTPVHSREHTTAHETPVRTPSQRSRPATSAGPQHEPDDLAPAEIFKKFCATAGQGGAVQNRAKARTMDFQEFQEMLKQLNLFPKIVSKHKAQELFRLANRKPGIGDGDQSELDLSEFEYAFAKLAEFLQVPSDKIWALSKTNSFAPKTPRARRASGGARKQGEQESGERPEELPPIQSATPRLLSASKSPSLSMRTSDSRSSFEPSACAAVQVLKLPALPAIPGANSVASRSANKSLGAGEDGVVGEASVLKAQFDSAVQVCVCVCVCVIS